MKYEVSIKGTGTNKHDRFEAENPGSARIMALRSWFGPDVFWDADETIKDGRVTRAREVRRHGKVRFVEEPVTRTVRITVRKIS